MNKRELKNNIEKLRNALNEIAANASDNEDFHKRLFISKQMDELIVEYMKLSTYK